MVVENETDQAQKNCLIYNFLPISQDIDELSFGFPRDIKTREKELTKNKDTEGIYHVGKF